MSKQYIFFDLDGVLINGFHSNPELQNRWDKDLEKDFGISPDLLSKHFFEGPFLDVVVGKADCIEQLDIVLENLNASVSGEELLDYWLKRDSVLYDDVMAVVKKLSKNPECKLYIATNQEHYRARYLWETLGFKNYFDDIYYSARLGCLKSDPRYFQKINSELNLQGKHIIFFDDSEGNMAPARAAGWDAVLVKTSQDLINHQVIKKLIAENT